MKFTHCTYIRAMWNCLFLYYVLCVDYTTSIGGTVIDATYCRPTGSVPSVSGNEINLYGTDVCPLRSFRKHKIFLFLKLLLYV